MERTEILERVWSAKEEKRRRGELAQSTIVLPFGVGYEKWERVLLQAGGRARKGGDQAIPSREPELLTTGTAGGCHHPAACTLFFATRSGWGGRIIDKKREFFG